MNYWLMKSEPSVYSIDHLMQESNQTEHWDGVRNYQARNMMRDEMKVGDQAFFYHSNCETPGIAGIVKIVKEGYPDFTASDPNNRYYDSKSDEKNPRWYMVDIQFEKKFKRIITLAELRQNPALKDMILLRKGNRLSVMPVASKHWQVVLAMV